MKSPYLEMNSEISSKQKGSHWIKRKLEKVEENVNFFETEGKLPLMAKTIWAKFINQINQIVQCCQKKKDLMFLMELTRYVI